MQTRYLRIFCSWSNSGIVRKFVHCTFVTDDIHAFLLSLQWSSQRDIYSAKTGLLPQYGSFISRVFSRIFAYHRIGKKLWKFEFPTFFYNSSKYFHNMEKVHFSLQQLVGSCILRLMRYTFTEDRSDSHKLCWYFFFLHNFLYFYCPECVIVDFRFAPGSQGL